MYWHLQKYLVEQTVRFIRRLYRYNTAWENAGLEIVQFASGSDQLAFQRFFEENESYPVITVGAEGGQITHSSINNVIGEMTTDSITLGSRSLGYATVTDVDTLAIQLPSSMQNLQYRAISLQTAWTGEQVGGEDLLVNLYSNYQTAPVLLASASIAGHDNLKFITKYAEFYPTGSLAGQDYWLVVQASPTSPYHVALDTNVTGITYSFQGTTVTGSINGEIFLPSFIRVGGHFEPTITVRVMSKNGTALAYDLSELIAQYFEFAKHAQLSRLPVAVNGLQYAPLVKEMTGELAEKGISLKTVSIGAVDMRRRGANDEIFTIPITLNFFTEWYQDYAADTLKDVTVNVQGQTNDM